MGYILSDKMDWIYECYKMDELYMSMWQKGWDIYQVTKWTEYMNVTKWMNYICLESDERDGIYIVLQNGLNIWM
jgi:hypothetical protein